MDYKYIEQLLERYYCAETSLQEERILRAFFSQDNVPSALAAHRSHFAHMAREAAAGGPGADFDARFLAEIERRRAVGARRITLARRLRPLMRAAAAVALICAIGIAAQQSLEREVPLYTPARHADTPIQALEDGQKAVPHYSRGTETAAADTLTGAEAPPEARQHTPQTKGM